MPAKRKTPDKLHKLAIVKTQFAVDVLFHGRYREGLREVEEALSYDPEYTRALNVKALALAALGRPDDSIETAEKFIALDPDNGISYSVLGTCYERAGDLSKADTAI
ncbi:MAG: tetratricopeptide repeat protein [bacterium]|nr:tetratricopeptide repeat protein [bacterium]